MIIQDKMPLEEALVHFGVKGMKWGVRKEQNGGSSEPRFTPEQKAIAKKVAIGVGALVVVAGTAVVVHQLQKNGKTNMKDIAKAASSAAKAQGTVKKIVSDPVDVVHFARGREKGLRFLKDGGAGQDVLGVLDKHFDPHEDLRGGIFRQVGNQIAAAFLDPDGRKDFAGRPITHQIIVPKSMTDGINNLDDVRQKIWPLVKDQYDAYYAERR